MLIQLGVIKGKSLLRVKNLRILTVQTEYCILIQSLQRFQNIHYFPFVSQKSCSWSQSVMFFQTVGLVQIELEGCDMKFLHISLNIRHLRFFHQSQGKGVIHHGIFIAEFYVLRNGIKVIIVMTMELKNRGQSSDDRTFGIFHDILMIVLVDSPMRVWINGSGHDIKSAYIQHLRTGFLHRSGFVKCCNLSVSYQNICGVSILFEYHISVFDQHITHILCSFRLSFTFPGRLSSNLHSAGDPKPSLPWIFCPAPERILCLPVLRHSAHSAPPA